MGRNTSFGRSWVATVGWYLGKLCEDLVQSSRVKFKAVGLLGKRAPRFLEEHGAETPIVTKWEDETAS